RGDRQPVPARPPRPSLADLAGRPGRAVRPGHLRGGGVRGSARAGRRAGGSGLHRRGVAGALPAAGRARSRLLGVRPDSVRHVSVVEEWENGPRRAGIPASFTGRSESFHWRLRVSDGGAVAQPRLHHLRRLEGGLVARRQGGAGSRWTGVSSPTTWEA